MSYNPAFASANAKGSSRSLSTGYQNGTASTIGLAAPVAVNSSGQIIPVNPALESTVSTIVGLTTAAIPPGANGQVTNYGRLENAQTGFPIGTPVWVSPTGGLTNIQPSLTAPGWSAGYFVIFVGVVVQNEFNPALQDIQLFLETVGQL